ncbi:Ca2+/H+ antiporter, TMEM165/GDT1 family [Bathymodiolus japonicus methanotrophic gill symbiont]|uniref:TMEM165/GDT1 family protein n=1 Tax=Bathymodiolus japonicus methanotrophic gill symbiont TaxID=113269 RepID=UPI001B419EAD|nr:TMEM165/GDT1 family protein [Bathymodiolus japonicus methanotrophic gill symbiont]GFO70885.1 Ca2+/H+ antiporter, TMEM165/GDT1 family [Bathymodiolus japonicus methanotrophic gill symbiont]
MDFSSLHLPTVFFTWLTPISTSYALIFVAEMGDKSQLVCMTLAAQNRAKPVIFGAITAFALLNTLAVLFGAAIANWVPGYIVAAVVTVLFAVFGVQSLFFSESEADTEVQGKSAHNLFITTFLLITVAEFGDKTQLAVAALSSTALPAATWIGATLALTSTSILGVIAGRTLLKKIPLRLLHRLSGVLFILLAGFAAYHTYLEFNATFNSFNQFLSRLH